MKLSLEHRSWLNRRVCVMDLSDVSRRMGVRVDGFVGSDVLSEFSAVRIDYKAALVEFEQDSIKALKRLAEERRKSAARSRILKKKAREGIMAGIVMMFLGIVVLGAVGVYVEIRRLVQLRRARLSRVYQFERQVKELIGRIKQLEGTTTSEAVRLISSYRLSSADSSVARLLRHMEQRAEALNFELGLLALQANAFIEWDVEDVRKNVEEYAKRIMAEETQ